MKETFVYTWKYPSKPFDYNISIFKYFDGLQDLQFGKEIYRNENGDWYSSNNILYINPHIVDAFNKSYEEYKRLLREEKLKRILK